MNKVVYLQELCNKYGDFIITNSFKDEKGEMHWFKHRSMLECMESNKGLWFITQATHRSSLKCEIILDMDEDISLNRLNKICDCLEKGYGDGLSYKAYYTGSKGYHIHILIPKMININIKDREKIRKTLIGDYKGFNMDLMKIQENSMIAIENIPHWKTGNIKKMIRCYR